MDMNFKVLLEQLSRGLYAFSLNQRNEPMAIHILGGVYREVCAWPERFHLLGSAGRAALCITNLSRYENVVLHSKNS